MKSLTFAAGFICAGVVLTGCAATGNSSAGTVGAQQTVMITPELKAEIRRQGHDPDEEICKRTHDLGSTIPKNVCATRAAWEAQTRSAQDGTRDIQNNALRTRDPNA